MIVRRHSILVLTIVLTFWAHLGSTKGERWSRQVLNSDWIPLANPRSLQSGGGGASLQGIATNPGIVNQPQVQQLSLPPSLRDQYHQQLLQLQETQESIQKLLQLQQQLRAQQQLLQAQSYLPEGFSTEEERKNALHQSTIANIQTLPHLAPSVLLPPAPGNQPQLPEFAAQDFLVGNQQKISRNEQIPHHQHPVTYNVNSEEQKSDKNEENFSSEKLQKTTKQGGQYKNPKQLRGNQNGEQFVSQTTPSSLDSQNDGEEEVQLLYVPAETLAQRDHQQKTQRVRNRKQYSSQQQQQQQPQQQQQQQQPQQQQSTRQQNRYQQQSTLQQEEEFQNQGLEGTRPSAAQQTFAHQVLYQLQQEQAKRTRIQQEEREKEVTRLREEQNELERQAKLHQELVFKEQDQRRQKELALRKELERQEEEARQKELQRIRGSNQRKMLEEEAARKKEVERQERLERQKIEEIRAQDRKQKEAESRQAEIDRLAALERQKELEIQKSIEQQQELERQQAEDQTKARVHFEAQRQAEAQAQLEAHRKAHQEAIETQRQAQIDAATLDAQNRATNQAQQQHLTETIRPKNLGLRSRQRQRNRQENQPTTPSPNQPPLSVYMGSTNPITNPEDLKISDVLAILKDAKTISVLDSVGPNAPQVFVGPTNLAPPNGYAKFDLPYLSAIDNNRVERKADKLPFFVAPLSFKPPPGYSKIPFPAPHIGSVVVNTIDNESDPLDGPPGGILKTDEDLQPNPTPLIEPNSYVERAQLLTGNPYVQHVTPEYSHEALVATTTPKYEASYSTTPSAGTRYRHRQFYSDRTPHSVSTAIYEDHPSTESSFVTRTKFRQLNKEEQDRGTSNYNNRPSSSSQPIYQENTGAQDHSQQNFAAGNREQEIGQHGGVTERYNAQSVSDQQSVKNSFHDLSQAHVAGQLYNPEGSSQEQKSEFETSQNRENQFVRGREDSRFTPGPTQYTINSELPRISPQLPGLVNSLIEEQELIENTPEPLTTTTTTSTTTTTTETPATTNRSRGRQRSRIVPTRAPTTTESAPTRSPVVDRSRRPHSRSRVRQGYGTTTETYQETIYDPTKSKFSGIQEKTHYSAAGESQRKPAPRSQRYRGRGSDRNAVQPEARPDAGLTEVEQNPPSHEVNYANNPLRHSLQEPSAPVQNINSPVYHEDVFLPSGNPSHGENDKLKFNTQNLQGVVAAGPAVTHENSALQHDGQEIEGSNYHTGIKTPSFGQTNVEQSPVNGFNYQTQNDKFENVPKATTSPQQYPVNSFNGQRPQNAEQIYSFHGNQATDSPGESNINNFQNAELNRDQIYSSKASENLHSTTDSDNLKSVTPGQNTDARPIFHHLSDENNQFLHVPSTTTEAPEVTTPRPTLTPAPLNGRQRLRSRLNQNSQRVHVDSAIQTRPTGSRDEFVRFSAVNQDTVKQHSSSGRIQPGGNRQRLRNRGQVNQANIQTEGNDYVRIQAPIHRPITTTTTTTEAPLNYPKKAGEEIEYGFIRPPSFKPIHPVADRPIANASPTYRPKYEQVQTEEPTNDAPVEVNTPQLQTLKNRQKYHLPSNRRPLTRSTTVSPPLTTTSTETQVEDVYTVRPKLQNDEYNGNKIRARVRRPGKRRTTTTSTTTTTTTTTEDSILDSNNELPLDENYPRIIQGVPAALNSDSATQRRTLFDEESKSPNLETLPEAVALQRPAQTHSFQHQENPQFPQQDFVLNFGVGSEQGEAHEEYDQTQLGSSHQRKYSHINRGHVQPHPASLSVADIEGAESQWSTKLTHSSFQPISLANQVHTGGKNNERQEKSEDSFDIITAGPDLASADRLVTSNDADSPRDIVVNASYLGNTKKEGFEGNGNRETPLLQGRSIVETKNETFVDGSSSLDSLQFWNNGQDQKSVQEVFNPTNQTKYQADLNRGNENDVTTTPRINQEALSATTEIPSTESDDGTTTESAPTSTRRTGQRRRRVRIRVRPAVDDFVSAESQHVSSAWNSLIRDKQNHERLGSFDDSKTTTMMPQTSSTTESTTEKSFLEELFDEMSKESDVIPAAATMTTSTIPDKTESTTTSSFSKIPEEAETQEFTTTPVTTMVTSKTDFTTVDSPATTIDHETTLSNEKFVTEATTERHSFTPKSHEKKKSKPSEPISEHHNRFHPQHSQKTWWNHNYDVVTNSPESQRDEETKTVSSKLVTDVQESTSEATTVTNSEEPESTSEHSISDYVNAFFKTMGGEEEQEKEEKIADSGAALESNSSLSDLQMEENKETKMTFETVSEGEKSNISSLVESTTVYGVDEVPEEKKVTNMEDALTTQTIEVITTTSGQEVTTTSSPLTTPEVPLSLVDITTEIPSTTTTISPTIKINMRNDPLAKVLRTSTTTEISHMTEICYRGRCVKTKSRREVKRR